MKHMQHLCDAQCCRRRPDRAPPAETPGVWALRQVSLDPLECFCSTLCFGYPEGAPVRIDATSHYDSCLLFGSRSGLLGQTKSHGKKADYSRNAKPAIGSTCVPR